MAKTKLQDSHRTYIVKRLACYDGPAEVAADLKQLYGIELSPQGVEAYDPNKYAGRNMAEKWVDLFETTRKAFLEHIEDHVPEANKAVRVRQLALAARAFRHRGNYVAMADMLEKIAKELGNVHTNKRELTGKDGKPIELAYAELTEEQLNGKLMEVLGELDGGLMMAEGGNGRGRTVKH